MAPSHSRQLLVWTLPTIAVLLSYLWYKKKRFGARSDTGDTNKEQPSEHSKSLAEELEEVDAKSPSQSPNRSFSRSLSGVDSAPIDIVIPRELRLVKGNPVIISDEDLDIEIEKIKSMKSGEFNRSINSNSPIKSTTPSPQKQSTPVVTPIKITNTNKTPKSAKKLNKSKNAVKGEKEDKKMAQEIAIIENKLSNSLKMKNKSKKNEKQKVEALKHSQTENTERERELQIQRQSSERDSANHSPADVMLASPSLSSISDNHSEGSSDSGKGGSDVATPPPSRTPGTDESVALDMNMPTIYEFVIPQSLVGKLIGRQGSFVTLIKDKTNAHIIVKKHPTNNKQKVCAIEGRQSEIDKALKLIRDKFPIKRYPDISLEQVSLFPTTVSLIPDHLYLKLVEGVNNDTIVSCMVSPYHLFLQQPTHPTFPNLNVLSNVMNICYSEVDSPLLPTPIPENTVCAAYSVDAWFRAMVLSTDAETETSYVKFLDYGGYAYVENSKLRQIRSDFILLPFQAAECLLANVKPLGETETQWCDEAYNLVADITKGAIIYTQVADYTEDGIPLVFCYVVVGPNHIVFLNQELVNQGFAEWVSFEDSTAEGAVGGVVA